MNDLDVIKRILSRAKIRYLIEEAGGKTCLSVYVPKDQSGSIIGDIGHYTDFTFDNKGKLVRIGIGE